MIFITKTGQHLPNCTTEVAIASSSLTVTNVGANDGVKAIFLCPFALLLSFGFIALQPGMHVVSCRCFAAILKSLASMLGNHRSKLIVAGA